MEMLLKIYCLGRSGYFGSLFNRFDCIVSISTLYGNCQSVVVVVVLVVSEYSLLVPMLSLMESASVVLWF